MNRSSLIGFLLLILFIIQFITGLLLSCYYNDLYSIAFNAVCTITINIYFGWLIRILHIIGASLFMLFLLLHFLRGFYNINKYNGINYNILIGFILFITSLLTSFIGYILNWGQMSFWGMTVIISILNSIWIIGDYVCNIIWPSYIIGLERIFILHYIIGVIILLLIGFHLFILHAYSSTNPLVNSISLIIPFYCYFFKDVLFITYLLFIINVFIYYEPDLLGNCDNNIPANPFSTPQNILPEWYFLLFYACLRSYPNKIIGLYMVFILFMLIFNYSIKWKYNR